MEDKVGSLDISQVHYTPIRPREGLIGFAQFVLNDAFHIGGIGVLTRIGREGIRLVYPVKKLADGTSMALFYPLSKEVGEEIECRVFHAIQKIGFGGMQ